MSAAFTSLGGHLGRWLPLPAGLFANVVLSLAIITPLVALLFKWLPDAHVPWKSAWIGAALTAVLFQAGALGVGLYLNLSGLGSAYGPAGSVLAILVWAYYTSQTVLYGAEFTKVYAHQTGAHVEPTDNAMFVADREGARPADGAAAPRAAPPPATAPTTR